MQPRRVMAAVLTTLLFGLVASANAAETLRSAAYEAQTANLERIRFNPGRILQLRSSFGIAQV